jgi:hypothetical protein
MASDLDTEVLQQQLDALVKDTNAAEAKAAATRRRVQAVLLLLEEEQATAANLEWKAAAAKGLLLAPSLSLATFDMVDGAACDSALVSNLHVQATTVPNVHQLVNIMLDTMSSNYAVWRDLMMMALTRYSLADHDAFPNNPAWTRMDAVVLCWLNNMLTPDLQEVA